MGAGIIYLDCDIQQEKELPFVNCNGSFLDGEWPQSQHRFKNIEAQ